MSQNPRQNRILAALPATEYARLEGDLELVTLPVGKILYQPGDSLGFIYFPTSCIVSLIYDTENGSSTELAMTGNDGLAGISLILGGGTTRYKVMIQSEGDAWRVRSEIIRWELDQGGALLRHCLCYVQVLMTQMAQSVVCNRHHTVDQQLCRWLLHSLDKRPANQIDMTQELIANMLGVRREAVTEAAGKLQTAGLIQYSRGHITVTDRPGLEARVCECYRVVRAESERLFQMTPEAIPRGWARPNPATTRKRAEARLKQMEPPAAAATEQETVRLLHELQVRQIELEMYNEELGNAYSEADSLREKYADIYDFAPIGYLTLDAQGVILQLNLAAAILLGIKRSQIGRHRFAASVKPDLLPKFNTFLAGVIGGESKKHCELVLTETTQRPEAVVRIGAVPDESHGECRMVVIDITAEHEAALALSERNHYDRALLDNFPFEVWLKDEQGRFLAVNRPLAQKYGWPSTDVPIGKTDFDLTAPELAQATHAADSAVMGSGRTITVEELHEVDGAPHWFETSRSPVMMDGECIGTVGFAHDITERKLMEDALRDLAATDAPTGLSTQTHFLAHLETAHAAVQRDPGQPVTLALIKLDHFGSISDTLGHAAGEAVLRLFSAQLQNKLRKVDVAGRMGGAEFAVLLPQCDLDAALVFAERILDKAAETSVVVGSRPITLAISIGISALSAADATPDRALMRADEALRRAQAKDKGRRIELGVGLP
jgi:diguanylate cyclase (GGDEF)-like protein/PAS domain S-box-containing protein